MADFTVPEGFIAALDKAEALIKDLPVELPFDTQQLRQLLADPKADKQTVEQTMAGLYGPVYRWASKRDPRAMLEQQMGTKLLIEGLTASWGDANR